MRISCSKCNTQFESLIIDKDIAWKEIFTKSTNHLKFKHPAMFEEMKQTVAIAIGAITTFLHFSEFVTIPEDETEILERIEKCQEVGMTALGFDPEDDEDDEEFEDDDIPAEEMPLGDIELPEGVEDNANQEK